MLKSALTKTSEKRGNDNNPNNVWNNYKDNVFILELLTAFTPVISVSCSAYIKNDNKYMK